MPITPLHFGVLAPINYFAPNKVSNVSFILVNLWIDSLAIINWFSGLALPEHNEENHTLAGVMLIVVFIAFIGMRSMKWFLGAFLGAISHIVLDSLVHLDMNPLNPYQGNPFYLGWMEPLSITLLPFLIWLIVQYVSYSRDYLKKD